MCKIEMDLIPEPVTITDFVTGKYIAVNKAFYKESGLSPAEVIGSTAVSLGVIIPPEREKLLNALRKNPEVEGLELIYRRPNGQQPFIALVSAKLTEHEGQQVIVVIARNMTTYTIAKNRLNKASIKNLEAQAEMREVISMLDEMEVITSGFTEYGI